MNITGFVNTFEVAIFRHRSAVLGIFTLLSLFFLYQATQIKLDAGFMKNIPLNHSYMQTYLKHREDLGGANNILVALCDKRSDIFNKRFFNRLKSVHDEMVQIPGVNKSQVKSLFSPGTRFVEVVEDGFAGGPVIPADFKPDYDGLSIVRSNIEKAGIIGRMVSSDFKCAMVTAQLLEVNPTTGEKLDTITFANTVEQKIRGTFEDKSVTIHIIGFAKMIGDVANGAKNVLVFFAIAIGITALMVFFFSRNILLTLLPITCSLVAVIWQMGLLTTLGFGIDPMSILVPFLIFAIGVSHGVQMINAVGKQVAEGKSSKDAAQSSFRRLLLPGGVALLSDTVGFITLLAIDIGIIRELAITASLGVAIIIFTNLILLPVLMSYVNFSQKYKDRVSRPSQLAEEVWRFFALFARPTASKVIIVIMIVGFVFGFIRSLDMKIGDLHAGAAPLHEYSRYNKDTFLITDKFAITTDIISVIAEAEPQSCTDFSVMTLVDQFQWRMANVEGVQSTVSLASISKLFNAAFNEGNPKWRVLPRNEQTLAQATSRIETSSGLLNRDCSVMPILVFLEDHKAETIERVVKAAKEASKVLDSGKVQFKLASGPVGVMAATNEVVSSAQIPMMLYVYGAVIALCLLSFRSVRATISVIIPLFIVSTLAQALMTKLEIGLTVFTLPVIALGVGIGVDYGIYILSSMSQQIRDGMPIPQAYLIALRERGGAVLFTGITLAIGVSTWVFSTLKFQMDMGILLTFMFIVNMLGAIVMLPAIAAVLWPKNKEQRR
ncbi:efflux RND transporter permease subunit [Algicola sagamiensis]|uniref:efflux RND transporter permease subunit n=1 Tax=Algicola sagamiensis TaxID=163869 RepID=UPI000370A345|nr:MMPL family transporter [Algicola sagamiensis]